MALTVAAAAHADPVAVVLTIPIVRGTFQSRNGPIIPFTASEVTFQASGDTSGLFSNAPGALGFHAPIIVSIPGVGSGTVTDPDAIVVVGNSVGLSDGFVGVHWPQAGPVGQGAVAEDSKLRDYVFQTSFPTSQVRTAQTTTDLRPTSAVYFTTDDGLLVAMIAGTAVTGTPTIGTLTINVGVPPQATGIGIPTLQLEGLVLLGFLFLAIGLWHLWRRNVVS
jgi:hypothetical protein